MNESEDQKTIEKFQNLWDRKMLWVDMKWRGHECWKSPGDIWLYQEAIYEIKPTLIVEFGAGIGGSALFFADMMDVMGIDGKVISIDIENKTRPEHPRVSRIVGDSIRDDIVSQVKKDASENAGPVMLIEDSNHNGNHVGKELEEYADLVTVGSYFVVEDMGYERVGSDVRIAVNRFIEQSKQFEVDKTKSRFMVTIASDGWLRRVA